LDHAIVHKRPVLFETLGREDELRIILAEIYNFG
jgi:hypothetical protein